MPQPIQTFTFKLDTVQLSAFEVPEEFDIGHELSLAVHKYVSENGQPVIKVHSLGAFPVPTTWSGILYGKDALSRHQTLDRLASAAKPITWVYGPLQYSVMIQRYVGKVMYQSEVRYAIDLVVITDNNGATPLPSSPNTINATVQSALSNANEMVLTTPAVPQNIIDESDALNAALQASYPLSSATISQIQAIAELVSAVIASTQIFIDSYQANATSETDLTTLNNMFNAMQSWGVVLTNVNILLGSVGPDGTKTSTTTVPAGSNLFQVATIFYPNVDLATAVDSIAQANGLTDNFIYTPTTIVLPPLFN